MSGITIVSDNSSLEASLLDFYGQALAVRRVWSSQWRDPAESAMDACAADPELLIIGGDVEPADVRSILPEVDRRFPSVAVLVLTQTRNPDFIVEMLRLGARDVIEEQPASEAFRSSVDGLLALARERRNVHKSGEATLRRRVISVLSPKGGTGKTTVATNLAVGLARRVPNQVLLIDLDVQFGDCAPALGLTPEHSLTQALASSNYERSALKVFLSGHPSGLAVLSPPNDLAEADEIDIDVLKRTVGALAEEFPFVIIDTAAGIDSQAVSAMEFSTDFLLVSTTDVPSIRALSRQIEALDEIGFVSQRRTFVLNRANAKVGLSVADVEAAIGLKASFQIPSSRSIPISTNEGIPAIDRETGSLSRRFEDIAEHFAPKTERQSKSMFKSLRKVR